MVSEAVSSNQKKALGELIWNINRRGGFYASGDTCVEGGREVLTGTSVGALEPNLDHKPCMVPRGYTVA